MQLDFVELEIDNLRGILLLFDSASISLEEVTAIAKTSVSDQDIKKICPSDKTRERIL